MLLHVVFEHILVVQSFTTSSALDPSFLFVDLLSMELKRVLVLELSAANVAFAYFVVYKMHFP